MGEITRVNSSYRPETVDTGIVHIGLGAFHRAHQAVYLERWLNRTGGGAWGICAANIRSNRALVDQLEAQDCRYHVAEYRDSNRVCLREINAIREVLFAGEDKQRLLQRLLAPSTRIVTLTVTEKAYHLAPSELRLLSDDPAIQHDITNPHHPKTVPGLLLEALAQRRERGVMPFTVLCCDNMPDNGARTRAAISQLARYRCPELAAWIDAEVAFPGSMVDRIVPAMTDEARDKVRAELDCADPAALTCEVFSQWVIEDRFPLGRPDWEGEGVQMVADVRPFETMKLRLLNGSHSLLAYVGILCGWQTVAEAVAQPEMATLVRGYMGEARATLSLPAEVDVNAYGESLLARFANDSLRHRLQQIAMDGSQKLPQRWLLGAWESLDRGAPVPITALGVAAWMHYVRGSDLRGRQHVVDDPLAAQLKRIHEANPEPDALVSALLALGDIFPGHLAKHADFRQSVSVGYRALARDGGLATLKQFLAE